MVTKKNHPSLRVYHSFAKESRRSPTISCSVWESFFLIGASAPAQLRRRFLASRIAESHHEFQLDPFLPVAEQLIQYDQEEIGEEFGQNLRNAFHLADVFVDASEVNRLRDSLQRSRNCSSATLSSLPFAMSMACFTHVVRRCVRQNPVDRSVLQSRQVRATS